MFYGIHFDQIFHQIQTGILLNTPKFNNKWLEALSIVDRILELPEDADAAIKFCDSAEKELEKVEE